MRVVWCICCLLVFESYPVLALAMLLAHLKIFNNFCQSQQMDALIILLDGL
jgi:hypothetical protein